MKISICDLYKKKSRDRLVILFSALYASVLIVLIMFANYLTSIVGTVAALIVILICIAQIAEALIFTNSCTHVYDVNIDNQYLKFNHNGKEITINIFDYKNNLIFDTRTCKLLINDKDANKFIQFNFNNHLKEFGELSELYLTNYMKSDASND